MIFNLQSSIFNARARNGGPRSVRNFENIDGFEQLEPLDRLDIIRGGGRGNNDFILQSQQTVIITPDVAAQEVAGGLTPAQIDLAARIETQEGASLGIFYGELLFGATNVVSHKYEPGVPRNTFTVLHGEGEGGLGKRGAWKKIVTAWYLGEELTNRFDFTTWFDDRLPPGAVASNGLDGWNWIQTAPTPYVGKYAHQSPNITGQHSHSFTGATQGLAILTGDTISVWIWIDPTNTPTEVMLQFNIGGDGEHRAYWGANTIALGTNGTDSRRQINAAVPATGQWVRLDVPASGGGGVGLGGTTIDGMSFLLVGGSATWDRVMRWQNTMSGNTGYVFRPGIIAPDSNDMVQTQDLTTWPAGTAQSGGAATTVRLNTTQSAQDRPDGFKARIQCRQIPNYDPTGQELFYDYGYSANPARVAADRILHFFERRYRDNPALAYEKFRARIYWPSWVAWRDYCDQLIPWDRAGDGTIVFIKRFEAHIGFPGDISLAQALDQLVGLSASFWQDTGKQLVFLPPSPRDPVHHFTVSNVVLAAKPTATDLRRLTNRWIARGRDIDDPYLGAITIEPPDNTIRSALRQDSISRVGENRAEFEFTNMTQSQMQRVLEYRARIGHDNPIRCSLVGNAKSIHVLKGDYVLVTHPVPGWNSQICLVLGITVKSRESSADEVSFNLQKIDGPLYDDTAHKPRQAALTL